MTVRKRSLQDLGCCVVPCACHWGTQRLGRSHCVSLEVLAALVPSGGHWAAWGFVVKLYSKWCIIRHPVAQKKLQSVPRAFWNSKSLKNVLIPDPGFALWLNFVLTRHSR